MRPEKAGLFESSCGLSVRHAGGSCPSRTRFQPLEDRRGRRYGSRDRALSEGLQQVARSRARAQRVPLRRTLAPRGHRELCASAEESADRRTYSCKSVSKNLPERDNLWLEGTNGGGSGARDGQFLAVLGVAPHSEDEHPQRPEPSRGEMFLGAPAHRRQRNPSGRPRQSCGSR